MKKIFLKIVILIFCVASLSSCIDYLTIKPAGKVVLGDYWKTGSDVDAVVLTCYRSLCEPTLMNKLIVYGEMRSDNVVAGNKASLDYNNIQAANILPSDSYTSWSDFYKVINYCNTVLYYAPKVIDPNYTVSQLKAHEAEVLTIRALSYFYLVRAFKNVPLVLTPSSSDSQDFHVPQSSEDQVLDQLESDLIKAEGWALEGYSSIPATRGRITKNAIRSLLADIFLWRSKYNESIAYCDKVIDSKATVPYNIDKYPLIKDIESPFLQIFGYGNSFESIFELQYDASSNKNTELYSLYGSNNLFPADYPGYLSVATFITSKSSNLVFNNTIITDQRRLDNMGLPVIDVFPIFKYVGYESFSYIAPDGTIKVMKQTRNPNLQTPNWIIYRLTDVMLMKAEALVQLSVNDNPDLLKRALKIVNLTYSRSNPTLTDTLKSDTYSTKSKMEDLVLLERQRELMFEGKRWFDLMRMARRDGNTKRLVDLVLRKFASTGTIRSKMADMNSLYFPVNQKELESNPKLIQNPYYITNY